MQVVTKDEMYAIDRYAMELGLHGEMLMENAGQAVTRKLLEYVNKHDRIAVLIGTGNNGGDGFVVARMLQSLGFDTHVWLIPEKDKLKGDAKKAMDVYERSDFGMHLFSSEGFHALQRSLLDCQVIVDALFGIGMNGSLRSPYKEIINFVNSLKHASVFSIDLPSGLPADGGDIEEAIRADRTITLHHPKTGAFTYPSREYYGELDVVHIGIPPIATEKIAAVRKVWMTEDVIRTFPKRKPSSHKGDYGKGLIVAGSKEMTGAAVMAAKAALRSGSGLLTVALPEEIRSEVSSQLMEAMFLPCSSENGQFTGELAINRGFDAIAIGPGLGRSDGSRRIVEFVLKKDVPLVVDADALFHLAEMKDELKKRKQPTVLTPHSGEMARLLDVPVKTVEQHRFSLSKQFASEYGVYLVLKGPYTICTTPNGEQFINATGNAALAKGGSGDVLTGIILAFLLQHTSVQEAISNAVFVHGKAADRLVCDAHSQIDIIASDVIEALPIVYKTIMASSSKA